MKSALRLVVLGMFLINGTAFQARGAAAVKPEMMSRADFDREVWYAAIANMVAYQPAAIGWAKFAETMGVNRESKAGRDLYREGLAVKKWAQVSSDRDTLKIGADGSKQLRIRLLDLEKGTFDINGVTFTVDPARTTTKDFKRFLNSQTEAGKAKSAMLNFFVPKANADDGDVAGLGVLAVVGTVGLGAATIGGAILTGAAIPAAAVAATGLAVTVGNLYCSFTSAFQYRVDNKWSEYLNCMTAPLSVLGINPRDKVYVSSLKCESFGPEVTVRSATGIVQQRRFMVADGKVQKFKVISTEQGDKRESDFSVDDSKSLRIESARIDLANRNGPGSWSRPTNNKQLDQMQSLVRDGAYYTTLCADPDRRAKVMRQVEAGNDRLRAADVKSTSEMLKTSK